MHRAVTLLAAIVATGASGAKAAADDADDDASDAAVLDSARRVFHVAALRGPFAELADFCRQANEPERCDPDEDGQSDDSPHRRPGPSVVRGRGRIREARVFVDGDACDLAIRTDGWWIREGLDLCRNSGTAMPLFHISALALRDLVGGKEPEVVLRMRSDFVHHADGWDRSHELVLCGINAAGELECLPNIVEDHRHRCFVGPDRRCSYDARWPPRTRSSVAVSIRRRGLVISARRGPLLPTQRASLGRHVLDWR